MDDMTVELVYENRLARVVVDGYSRAPFNIEDWWIIICRNIESRGLVLYR